MLQQGMSYRKNGKYLNIHWTRAGQIIKSDHR
jgi:hypothetical protein